ncbi:Uncharacterized protein APZ42_000737 [Daphnia magna]|uniref:Uncharacterized protein n=1 Tax=Daphnia magna TaxID=35525 RepID=A0A162C8Y4_9CRUS|nr:Uncharacterized protein APZ42_000737 [Daphnia magna]
MALKDIIFEMIVFKVCGYRVDSTINSMHVLLSTVTTNHHYERVPRLPGGSICLSGCNNLSKNVCVCGMFQCIHQFYDTFWKNTIWAALSKENPLGEQYILYRMFRNEIYCG